MHTVKRSDLTSMNQPTKSQDLWNKSKLCYIAFKKYPNATEIKYSVGSGCYVDIKYKDENGQEFSGVVYDHRDDNYLDS